MVDRADLGSWLDGPQARRDGLDAAAGRQVGYAGDRLGLPREGSGSIARFGRRLVAICIDWASCLLLARLLFGVQLGDQGGRSLVTLGIFAVENIVLVSLVGSTLGMLLLGIGVMSLDGRRANPMQVIVRTVLLCLAVPALIWDRDGRGLHDKVPNTVIARR